MSRKLPHVTLIALLLPGLAAAAALPQILPLLLPGERVALLRADGDRVVVDQVAAPPGVTAPGPVDLRAGDVIGRFQDLPMPSLPLLREAIAGVVKGDRVSLEVLRGGEVLAMSYDSPGAAMVMMQEAPSSPAPDSIAVPGGGGWTAAPGAEISVATDPAGRARALLAAEVEDGEPGISLAAARDGEVLLVENVGLADLDPATPMDEASLLPAASVTKAFTGFAVATLAAEGKLSLDDDIRRFLPEMHPFAPPITIADLAHHTSGLKDYTGLLGLQGWKYGDALTRGQLMSLLTRQREVYTAPGSQHRYSNSNYFLLAEIIARASGRPFADYVAEVAFVPAGLSATVIDESTGRAAGSAATYSHNEGRFEEVPSGEGPAGAGGIITSAAELARWGSLLGAGRLGTPPVIEIMARTATLTDGSEISYALGLGTSEFHGHRRLGHSGSSPGSASVLHVYPDDGLAIAVLANRDDVDTYAIAEQMAMAYLEVQPAAAGGSGLPAGAMMITDEDMKVDTAMPRLPDAAARFAGRYALEGDREWVIEFQDGYLLLHIRDDIDGVQLVPVAENRFLFRPGRFEISFTENASGQVDGLVWHVLENSVRRGEPRDIPGRRIVVAPLTGAERAALAGDYVSDELEVVYSILDTDGQLWLESPVLGRLPMAHQSGDVFSLPGRGVVRVEFRRDGAAVTGLQAEAYAWGTTAEFRRR